MLKVIAPAIPKTAKLTETPNRSVTNWLIVLLSFQIVTADLSPSPDGVVLSADW
jgi:hypothetical protein